MKMNRMDQCPNWYGELRVENRDGQHTLLSYMLASFVLSNWRLQVTFPFRSKKKEFRLHCAYNTIYNFTQWQVGGGTSINNSDSAQRERGWRKTGRVLVRVRISKEAKASTNELIRLVLSENVENHRTHFWLSYCCVLYYSKKKIKVLNAALTCCCWPHNNRKVEWVYYRYVTHRGELHFENFTAYLTNSQTNHKLNEKSAWIWISDCCGCVDSGHILDNFSN